jgi:cytochrome c553
MRRTLLGLTAGALVAATISMLSSAARAQQTPTDTQQAGDPATCEGMLANAGSIAGVLSSVPRYGSTWVMVVPQRLAEKVPNAAAPGIADIQVGVQAGTAGAEIARAIGVKRIKEYPVSAAAPVEPLKDIKEGTLDAAILWGPAAGLGIVELGLDEQVILFTVDKPRPGPAALRATASNHPCAFAIRDTLDVNGVLPAELLVAVDIRDLMSETPPRLTLDKAREGGALFNQVCARCHGTDAVADPHGLAPVDLRISVPRFSYPGFHYIVLNGRPMKSMPPFRGTLTDDQIGTVYQYLQARSRKLLPETSTPQTTTTNGGSN